MFSILSATYKDGRNGVTCYGVIAYNGIVVGKFHQRPSAACIPIFKTVQARSNFFTYAKGMSICDYCEKLLREWEDRELAKHHNLKKLLTGD